MLKGELLIEKVKELGNISKSELVRRCGYVYIAADGSERLNFTSFYEALLEAKGIDTSVLRDIPDVENQSNTRSVELDQDQRMAGKIDSFSSPKAHVRSKNQVDTRDSVVTSDSFLSQLSDESLEVLQHFGAEAPKILNDYSCAVEDALLEQVERNKSLVAEVKRLTNNASSTELNSSKLTGSSDDGLELTLNLRQLSAANIVSILNRAYYKSEVQKIGNEGTDDYTERAKCIHDNYVFYIETEVSIESLKFTTVFPIDSSYNVEVLMRASNILDSFPVDMTYLYKDDDGNHAVELSLLHVFPEGEAIKPSLLVKLTRYYLKYCDFHIRNWDKIIDAATN